MFWIGLGVGAIIGVSFGIFIVALCTAAKEGDKE